VNHDKTLANKGSYDTATPPPSGEGCGDTLQTTVLIKKGTDFFQRAPPYRISLRIIDRALRGHVSFSQVIPGCFKRNG